MVLRANPARLRVVHVAEHVGRECAVLAHTFRGPGALARADQLVQASTFIGLKIAEGCGCGTVAHFRRFILQARASAQETLAMLRMIVPVDETQRSTIRALQSRTVLILKQLTRLYKHPPVDWQFH
jgi:four helix bundle protein